MHHIGYKPRLKNYIIKAHLNVVVASSTELPYKCLHLIKIIICLYKGKVAQWFDCEVDL